MKVVRDVVELFRFAEEANTQSWRTKKQYMCSEETMGEMSSLINNNCNKLLIQVHWVPLITSPVTTSRFLCMKINGLSVITSTHFFASNFFCTFLLVASRTQCNA